MALINHLRELSVSKLMLLVTILVAILPVLILGYHLYNSAWKNSWREIHEKHQLLAQNLATPLSTYVSDHKAMLGILSETLPLVSRSQHAITSSEADSMLKNALTQMSGFKSIHLLDMHGNVIAQAGDDFAHSADERQVFSKEKCYLMTRKTGAWTLSKVKRHPVTGTPTIFMGQAIKNTQFKTIAILLGELKIDLIENIRKQVRFGLKGHSAIVDQTGQVIAHPNGEWMKEIRNLSDWRIVQSMKAGETGVTSFYSPFMKGNMVAGYASVPEIGWGIMVPQPEAEVAATVNELMRSHIIWGVAGLIIAILLAIAISRWVTKPLNRLAHAGRELMQNGVAGNLPMNRSHSPKEINQLANVLRSLITNLQTSRDEVQSLNENLQQRVDVATQQLRDANARLAEAAQSDFLTHLANRRYFEDRLQQTLSRRSGDIDHVCVMLIDIDHFKQINDSYGHAAGDAVLSQVARILERAMRSGDMVARYGGDEFVAYLRCEHEIGVQRANEIHAAIENGCVQWEGKSIHMTVSVGLFCQQLQSEINITTVLKHADDAMYQAKHQGRNRVVDISR